MKSISWKVAAEFVGIAAIVASLIFVGLQLKQSQEIAIAETYMSILSSEIEVRNAVNAYADIWAKANSGSELDGKEIVIFGNLVANLNSETNRSLNQLRRLGHISAAEAQVHDFAIFLYQNPAVRRVWTAQQEFKVKKRALLMSTVSTYTNSVLSDLEKLDRP